MTTHKKIPTEDPLSDAVAEYVVTEQKCVHDAIAVHFQISEKRTLDIIEELAHMGIVSRRGATKRKVLIASVSELRHLRQKKTPLKYTDVLLRVLSYTRPYKHYLPEYIIYTFLGILFGVLNYTLLIPLLDILFKKISVQTTPLPDFSFSVAYVKDLFLHYFYQIIREKGLLFSLFFVCGTIFCALMLSNIFKYLTARLMGRVTINLLAYARSKIYTQLIHQDLSFHNQRKKGEMMSLLVNDVGGLAGVLGIVQSLIKDPLMIIVYLSALFYISPQLTWFTLFFFPVSGGLLSKILKNLKKEGHYSQSLLAGMLSHIEEALGGIKIIKAFHAEQTLKTRFEHINQDFTRISRKMYNKRELAAPVSEFLGVTIMLVIVTYAGYLVINEQNVLRGSEFIAYIAIYSQMLGPLKSITNNFSALQSSQVLGERVFSVLDAPIALAQTAEVLPKKTFDTAIRFENVWFKYQNNWVLKDITFDIPKGKHIALVGKSGSGKTTTVDLILYLYQSNKGKISIDGTSIERINMADWYKLIGFVGQESLLFNDTITANIVFSNEKPDMERLIAACKTANAHEFIMQLEKGYDTLVGDRGNKLSGGQKQRITIARALYNNPPILIFDEATASLDSASEKAVQKALEQVTAGRTTLVIAHRLSTIVRADNILVMHEGAIVESGQHHELLAKGGTYAELIKLQQI